MSGAEMGWYASLIGADGNQDYVAGNLGLNSRYQASPAQPVSVCARDLDNSGSGQRG